MSWKRELRFALTIAVGIALAVPMAAQNESPLVQAAKAKATDKKAKHVYTNDDYPERPDLDPPAQVSPLSTAADSAATTDKNGKPGSSGSSQPGEAAKPPKPANSKLAELQDQLNTSKHDEQQLREKLAALQEKADNEKDDFRRQTYRDIIDNQQTTLSQYDREQEELQKKIDAEKKKSDPQ